MRSLSSDYHSRDLENGRHILEQRQTFWPKQNTDESYLREYNDPMVGVLQLNADAPRSIPILTTIGGVWF